MGMIDLKKNSVMWDGKEGFYEAFYVQCNDPISGMAWWFRYSIMIPQKGRGFPYAALWAIQFDQSGARGPIAMKHIYPITHYRFEKDRFILYIENGFLTNSHAMGKIKHGGRSLEWDIQWTPEDEVFVHYPNFLYKSSFPKTKVVSPHWATKGGGFVRWNDGEFFLSDALIHVGHVWGNSHTKRWAWVHTHGFEENPSAVFEGLWVPICGPLGMYMCWFRLDEKISRFTGLGSCWQQADLLKNNKWNFKLNDSKFKLDGSIVLDNAHIAGITYHDPTGGRRYCYNSKVASVKMNVLDKAHDDKFVLTAPSTAAFEICLPHELEQFSVLL